MRRLPLTPYGDIMRTLARVLLASGMIFAGLTHLFWGRRDFRAQVPDWAVDDLPLDKDAVVLISGVVEIGFGAALLTLPRERRRIGTLLALFFAAIFPGNVDQWRARRSAFGLDTDAKRFGRLFFQPVLIAWAWWSTR